ncbi:vitamin K epoxide reductase family protein [Flavobacterium anhuiense]|uniref:vitamin K epoxide reductase family protein n=1 Tax=Flavobacterium anhuiense TaxID=459526 RepID=UPI0020275ABC|nr:vitamin K epoxide reductase family protein [Flavobacterium anhuiense]URM35622.1 hypothetical protein LLY39_14330 [Flavobacterium anhuiense]
MVKLVQKYLRINNFNNQTDEFEDLFQSHPDYPSLFAITDTFDLLSIENLAVRISKEQLAELPESFLAAYKYDIVLVTQKGDTINIESEDEGKKSLALDDFVKDWDGIVTVIEPNEGSKVVSLKSKSSWHYYGLAVLALVVISFVYNSFNLSDVVLLLTSIAGLVFSVFIVQEKLGVKSEIISKFCGMSSNASCDSVIGSEKGEINKWVNFSDLPVLFFGINLIALLLNPTGASAIIGFLSILSIPVIFYSIYVQKWQLKKWCLLCLTVSAIIILQSAAWILMKESFVYNTANIFSYLFSIILISSSWLGIKPVLTGKMKAEEEVNSLKKFKRNYKVLSLLTKEVPVLDGLSKLQGLQFGNANADVELLIILSPSCGHCHKAFESSLELIKRYPEKISLKVLFNINPENTGNQYKIVVDQLLEINYKNKDSILEAISDWHIRKIGLEKWLEKWNTGSTSMRVNQQVELQYNWCRQNQFNYTPVKIVNDQIYPHEYEISDLRYFLSDLSEAKSLKEVV